MSSVTGTAAPATATGTPPAGTILAALLRADWVVFRQRRRTLVISLLLPLVILVTSKGKRLGHDGLLELIGLAITYGLLSTSLMGYALTVSRDREIGVFQRLRVTPATTWMIMASRLGIQVVVNLVIALVVVIVGARIHNVSLSLANYLLVLAVSILAGAMFLAIGQTIVGLVKSAETVQAVARVVFGILFVIGVLGLDGVLGGFWNTLAKWSPVGVSMTLFTGVIRLSDWAANDSWAILAAFGYIVILAGIGIRWFQWQTR